uniref:Putative secreted protein n=1 Tax=Anopheles marajoara TaxID=58244 RepID=A0A2M4CFI2_9DIPT
MAIVMGFVPAAAAVAATGDAVAGSCLLPRLGLTSAMLTSPPGNCICTTSIAMEVARGATKRYVLRCG